MAKRNSSQGSSSERRNIAMPGNMKLKIESGGDIDSIEKQFKNNALGNFLRIGKDEEYVLAIMNKPTDWHRAQEHALTNPQGGWAYLPCTSNCPACKKHPENAPRWYAFIPVYIYEYKKVQYFRAPSTVVTSSD